MDNYAYQPDENNEIPFAITRHYPRTDQNNYLVEVNSRSKFLKKNGSFKILSMVLLVLVLLLLIGLITLIVLYTRSKSVQICTTNECLRTASSLKSSIDFSVDPCDDFYKFACGKWSEEHPNHGWWKSFSSFTTISERVAIASLNALTATEDSNSTEPQAIRKSKDFFKSCLDIDTLNGVGLTSMYKFLQRVKLPIIPNYLTMPADKWSSFSFDWMKTETLIKQNFMMDVFIGAIVSTNIFNGTENVIYVGKIFQNSPLPSPLKTKKEISKRYALKSGGNTDDITDIESLESEVNIKIIKYVFKEVLANSSVDIQDEFVLKNAAEIILELAELVDQLVANISDIHSTASADDIYTITMKSLQSLTDSTLPSPQPNFWLNYFNYLFKGTDVTFDPERDLLYVTDEDVEFIERILPIIINTPPIEIELYMWWQAVYVMIMSTSTSVADYIDKQLDLFGSNANYVARTRSLECALLVNNYMGYAISYAIADQSFPNTTKPKVERLVSELKQSFVEVVKKIKWMDDVTKKVTIEKIQEMISFIGYPNWLFEKGKLDEYYGDVEINATSFLENMINTIISQNLKVLNSLRKKHERDWYSEPIEVNAFNSYSENAINVPMAILTYPMYHLGLEVLNYGSIGSILGHELTHGFDNMGRKHDKFGNLVQWWTNKTIENFEDLTKCFIEQYEDISIEGVDEHVNGEMTLGENLADNGGLNHAFTAYRKYVEKFGNEPKLPGFENYTNFQLFFIAYGSIWCQTISEDDIEDQLKYDEHSPNSVRVLGSLQNSEDFSKFFNCPKDSRMNPVKKCKVW